MELIVGAGRPVETWGGSSLWANRLYTEILPHSTYYIVVKQPNPPSNIWDDPATKVGFFQQFRARPELLLKGFAQLGIPLCFQ